MQSLTLPIKQRLLLFLVAVATCLLAVTALSAPAYAETQPGSATSSVASAPATFTEISNEQAKTLTEAQLDTIFDNELNIFMLANASAEDPGTSLMFLPAAVLALKLTVRGVGFVYKHCKRIPFVGKRCQKKMMHTMNRLLAPITGKRVAKAVARFLVKCVVKREIKSFISGLSWVPAWVRATARATIFWFSPC